MAYESYRQIRTRLEREARSRGYKPGSAKWNDYVEGTWSYVKEHRSAKWRRIFSGRDDRS